MRNASRAQSKVLAFIGFYLGRYGYAPTMREIAEIIPTTSTNCVHGHLSALIAKGLLTRGPKKASRTLLITEQGRALIAANREAYSWGRKHAPPC